MQKCEQSDDSHVVCDGCVACRRVAGALDAYKGCRRRCPKAQGCNGKETRAHRALLAVVIVARETRSYGTVLFCLWWLGFVRTGCR